MNVVSLIGRLTKDPEIRYTSTDMPIARYTLAVQRNADDADFISCVCFDKCADFADKHLKKGMKIGIVGRINTGVYEAQDGTTRYTTDVIVSSHTFCEKKEDSDGDDQKGGGSNGRRRNK